MRNRTMVIDEDLLPRLATDLRRRGRDAQSVAQLDLRHATDPELLEALAGRDDLGDWILVTGNDRMPEEHPETFRRLAPTVATIDPRQSEPLKELHWRFDVVQRWAHRIQEQEPGTVCRYTLGRGGIAWTPRRRPARLVLRRRPRLAGELTGEPRFLDQPVHPPADSCMASTSPKETPRRSGASRGYREERYMYVSM